jgi:hypothetical protein
MRACHIVGNLFGAQHRAFMFSAKIGSAAAPHTVIVRRDFRQQTKSRCFSACGRSAGRIYPRAKSGLDFSTTLTTKGDRTTEGIMAADK